MTRWINSIIDEIVRAAFGMHTGYDVYLIVQLADMKCLLDFKVRGGVPGEVLTGAPSNLPRIGESTNEVCACCGWIYK